MCECVCGHRCVDGPACKWLCVATVSLWAGTKRHAGMLAVAGQDSVGNTCAAGKQQAKSWDWQWRTWGVP
eukprot:8796919-Alexandrium_andersonii.AAC.1